MLNNYANDGKAAQPRIGCFESKCCRWSPPLTVCLQIQINTLQAPFAGVWPSCLRKMYCPRSEALLLCIALATVWKIYSTAARLKNGISSGWLPSILLSIWFFLMMNGISVWNSAAAPAQEKGPLKGRCWCKLRHTLAQTYTRMQTN